MKIISSSALLLGFLPTNSAFVAPPALWIKHHPTTAATRTFGVSSMKPLQLSSTVESSNDEIERLKSMAAKLRAEAAALEAEQQAMLAQATQQAFEKFDINKDGTVSLAELKQGLEKALKTELPESQVQQLLQAFDESGDGVLQLDEFVTVERFRNKLDAIVRDEKAAALEKKKLAQLEQEAVKFLEAQLEVLNDRPPTTTDKLVSTLPYLFPLLDSLVYARFLVVDVDNPLTVALTVLYALYRSVPFGGFIAFFTLSFLSNNPRINRLIRFNMQQAIYLDIALFFPGLLAGIYSLVAQGMGMQLPPSVTEIGSDVLFFTLLAAILYSSVSSLLGILPDKIPLISQAALNRLPSIDMLDEQGRFRPRLPKEDDETNKTDE